MASPVRWFWRSWKLASGLLDIVPRGGPGLSKLFDRFGFYLVRDRTICFDDIERHGKQLDLRDFFGLVSYLSEQRGCRVVVILNDGQFDKEDMEIWESYREKVFQGEVTYAPTPEQTVELGLKQNSNEVWHEPLQCALMELGLSNIRLVRRSAYFMGLVQDLIGDAALQQATIAGISRTIAMLVFSIHGRGAGGPPLERVLRAGRLDMAVYRGETEDDRSEQERKWDLLISSYRLYLHNELDNTLVAMVQRGYPDSQKLRSALKEVESNNEIQARKQAWHKAWRLYHDTISENGPEIVAAFERTWPSVSASEHPANLESAVRILRMLGRSDLATSFIRIWIDDRRGDRMDELQDRELHSFRRVQDSEILEAVETARGQALHVLPLQNAFDMLRASNGYPEKAIASFATADVDDIVHLIDNTVGEDLVPVLRRILELRSNHADRSWVGASEKVQRACEMIASRSVLAADRIRNWFGIDPKP